MERGATAPLGITLYGLGGLDGQGGAKSNMDLANVQLTSTGLTTIKTTGHLAIDPGASYSYDHWTETSSSGNFFSSKTTVSDHVRESTLITPSRIHAGEIDIGAQGDILITATELVSAGKTTVLAGGNLKYQAAKNDIYSHDESHTSRDFMGFEYKSSTSTHTARGQTALVTSVQSESDVLSYSKGNTLLEGTRIVSAHGEVKVLGQQKVDILPAVNSSFVEDTYQESSPLSLDGGIKFNHKERDTRSDASTTLTGAHLEGATVTVEGGGDVQVIGSTLIGQYGATVHAGGNALVDAGYEQHITVHQHEESAWGIDFSNGSGRLPGLGSLEQIHDAQGRTLSPVVSHIESPQGKVTIQGEQNVAVLGAQLTAKLDIDLIATAGRVFTGGAQHTDQQHIYDNAAGSWLNTDSGYQDDIARIDILPADLKAGGQVNFKAGQGVTLGAVNIDSGGKVVFAAPELTFTGEKTLDQVSHTDWDTDFAYRINAGRGHVTETLNLATLNARGGIEIPTGTKVSFTLDGHLADPAANADALANAAKVSDGATPTAPTAPTPPTLPTVALTPDQFKQLAQDLSAQPGLAYLGDLAQRPDINWQAIATAHQQWDYKTQGLTEAGALLVAIAVGYATAGLGSELLGTSMAGADACSVVAAQGGAISTSSFGGITLSTTTLTGTTYSLAGTMANAGLTSLATTASISLINNGGDLGATLRDLGSSDTFKGMLSSMLTAGVTSAPIFDVGGQTVSLNDLAGIKPMPGIGSVGTFNWDNLGQNTLGIAGRGIVTAGIGSALNGSDFGDAFVGSVVGDFSALGANYIGATWGSGPNKNPYLQTLGHGLLGCAAATATGKDCASGAAGGVGESILGNIIDTHFDGLPIDPTTGGYSPTTRFLYTGGAILFADIVANASGLDAGAAGNAALNAATNNYLSHLDNQTRADAAQKCQAGDQEACATKLELDTLDKQRDADFHAACDGQSTSDACGIATSNMLQEFATFFPTVPRPADPLPTASPDAALAPYTDKSELQSYVPLLAVAYPALTQYAGGGIPSALPTTYNSDIYGVIDPKNPATYAIGKFGGQWYAIGVTDVVFTDIGAVNGLKNPPDYAPGLMGVHTQKDFDNLSLFTLFYNPDKGIWSNMWDTAMDKLGFTSPVTQQFSQVLGSVQTNGHAVTWVVHSQGGEIFAEGVRFYGGDLSLNSVIFHAGANNAIVTNGILDKAGIPDKQRSYQNDPFDAVPNIVGLNGNPFEMIGSLLAFPTLFMGPEISRHTLPPATPLPVVPKP